MLYFYKILGLLIREMGLFLLGKFFICCGALGLGLEPALITSLTPTSHTKNMLSSKALASTSNGPNEIGINLLIAALTRPS